LASCFFICGHEEWAEEILSTFSYGEAFLHINGTLLRRYAACTSEEDIKFAEASWLKKIELEYAESRADPVAGAERDDWQGGNMNRRRLDESEDEDAENGEMDSEEEAKLPELPEMSDDEEDMAELRRKVLASKPFTNLYDTSQANKLPQIGSQPPPLDQDADAMSGSELGDDAEFNNVINATPLTDRTGIIAMQRARTQDQASATFSRTVVTAPKKW